MSNSGWIWGSNRETRIKSLKDVYNFGSVISPFKRTCSYFSKKKKKKTYHVTQKFHSWVYIWKKKFLKDTCTLMFRLVLLTIAKMWKQPVSINR